MPGPNYTAAEKALRQREQRIALQILQAYYLAIESIVDIVSGIQDYDPAKLFRFSDYPQIRDQANVAFRALFSMQYFAIKSGIEDSWNAAGAVNDELLNFVYGANKKRLPKKLLRKYQNRNLQAMAAFVSRKEGGMSLSSRVWKTTRQARKEIELGLDIGLGEGRPAADLARDLKRNLRDPDRLFRRVRDKYGNLVLSKNAKAYHPGRGVYRSSYKNSLRMAGTEVNMAYREADHQQWQNMDYVVGFEIRLSRNPNTCPVCEALAGKYPKDFIWNGWHPQCRCFKVPILKSREEMNQDMQRILSGQEPLSVSENAVTDMPGNFKKWIADNRDRIDRAKSTPYFIRDNFKGGNVGEGLKFATVPMARKSFVPAGLKKYTDMVGVNPDERIFSLLKEEVPIRHNNSKGAYYHTIDNYVNLPADKRRMQSKWSAESVIYHEFGHVADWQHGIKNMPEVRAVMDKYRVKYADNAFERFIAIDDDLWSRGPAAHGAGEYDLMNQVSAAHDTLMALDSNFGAGHSKAYFAQKGMPEAEFIAHMFENRFIGNPVFKEVMGDLYEDMLKLVDEIIEKIAR